MNLCADDVAMAAAEEAARGFVIGEALTAGVPGTTYATQLAAAEAAVPAAVAGVTDALRPALEADLAAVAAAATAFVREKLRMQVRGSITAPRHLAPPHCCLMPLSIHA